jgi:hypothetical protein
LGSKSAKKRGAKKSVKYVSAADFYLNDPLANAVPLALSQIFRLTINDLRRLTPR